MNIRKLVSLATLALAAVTFGTGCPADNQGPGKKTAGGSKTGSPTGATKPAATGAGTAKTAAAGKAYGTGVIKGSAKFTGEAVEMKEPTKRKTAEFCKDKPVKANAVIVKDGKLADVLVAIADEQLKGPYTADKAALIEQKDCMFQPRIQAVLTEQKVQIRNDDPTLHNVRAGKGADTVFNAAQPKGAPVITKSFDEPGMYRFGCDVHPWMRAFVVATDNPFHAVTGADGTFKIEKVPDGKYKVYAWHSLYGRKEKTVEVKGGEVTLDFEYDGTEDEPPENAGELNDMF